MFSLQAPVVLPPKICCVGSSAFSRVAAPSEKPRVCVAVRIVVTVLTELSDVSCHCQLSGANTWRLQRPFMSILKVPRIGEVAVTLKADSHIACRAHAVPIPRPCRAAKGLECVFPIWFTQCGRVWFTLAMPCPCHALTLPFSWKPRHSTAVERHSVGYLPAFGFFRLPRGVPRRLLSEAYQSFSQRSIPTTVRSGSSTLQKKTIC